MYNNNKLFIYLIFFLTLLSACQKSNGVVVSILPEEFSAEDQRKIGLELKNAIIDNPNFKVVNEVTYSKAYFYVSTLMNSFINSSNVKHRNDYDWSVTILEDNSLKAAFFLPGGHFFVSTGLLKFLDAEHQFLSVLGHEMYYADTDLMIEKVKSELGGLTLGDILLGNEVSDLRTLVTVLPEISFEEKEVIDADNYSISLICQLNYHRLGIKEVLEKSALSSMPVEWTDNRIYEFETRITHVGTQALECGFEGLTNELNYQKFVTEDLP